MLVRNVLLKNRCSSFRYLVEPVNKKIFCACAEDRNMAAFSQPNLKRIRFDRILQSFLMSEEISDR